MSKKVRQSGIPSERIFEFVRKFNQLVTLDEGLARQLPAHEFELNFDQAGRIYIDGKPLGVSVQQRQRLGSSRTPTLVSPTSVKVNAWNNGKYNPTGAGYGLRLNSADRDALFDRSWKDITLDLPNGTRSVRIRLSPRFWHDCPELRSAAIGRWLVAIGYGRWPRNTPPRFSLIQVSGNHFKVA